MILLSDGVGLPVNLVIGVMTKAAIAIVVLVVADPTKNSDDTLTPMTPVTVAMASCVIRLRRGSYSSRRSPTIPSKVR